MWSEQPSGLSPFEVQYLQNQPYLPRDEYSMQPPPPFMMPDFPISDDYSMAGSFALKEEPPEQLQEFTAMPMYPKASRPPSTSQSASTRRKRALLIGITYQNEPSQKPLPGVIESTHRMKQFISNLGYEDILTLIDTCPDPNFWPTRRNIINAINWLVSDVAIGDILFFQYLGHGVQTPDLDGDEDDEMDEAIVPMDYKQAGLIVDDELHDILVKKIPYGAVVTAVMDTCHSGTALDLPYVYTIRANWCSKAVARKQSMGDVVLFSSCRDDQSSFYNQSKYGGGAFSAAFMEAISQLQNPTYQKMLMHINSNPKMLENPQEGQISSGRAIDMNQTLVM